MKAIDVSCWQQDVDYNKVKNSGINVVLIRAGFGRDASQKRFSICTVWNIRSKQWLIIMFSSNTSGSKEYTNVSLTKNS